MLQKFSFFNSINREKIERDIFIKNSNLHEIHFENNKTKNKFTEYNHRIYHVTFYNYCTHRTDTSSTNRLMEFHHIL